MDANYFKGIDEEASRIEREYRLDGLGGKDFYKMVLAQREKRAEFYKEHGYKDDKYGKGGASDYILRKVCGIPGYYSKEEVFHEMDVALVLYNGGTVDDLMHASPKLSPVDVYTSDVLASMGYEPFRFIDMGKEREPVLPLVDVRAEREEPVVFGELDTAHLQESVQKALDSYCAWLSGMEAECAFPYANMVITDRTMVEVCGGNCLEEADRSVISREVGSRYWVYGMSGDMLDDLEAAYVLANCDTRDIDNLDAASAVQGFLEANVKDSPFDERLWPELAKHSELMQRFGFQQLEPSAMGLSMHELLDVRLNRAIGDNQEVRLNQYGKILETAIEKRDRYDEEDMRDALSDEVDARIDCIMNFDSPAGKERLREVFDETSLALLHLRSGGEKAIQTAFDTDGHEPKYLHDETLERLSNLGFEDFADRMDSKGMLLDLYVSDEDLGFYPDKQAEDEKAEVFVKPSVAGERVVDDSSIDYGDSEDQMQLS